MAQLNQTAEVNCAADYYVKDLPGLPQNSGLKQFAGHIPMGIPEEEGIFFWLVQHHQNLDTEKLVIWFNGGPGCSSMDGMFMENGPFSLQKDHTLMINEHSWHKHASVLYVDQPIGTGFSFTKTFLKTLPEITNQFIIFLEKIFKIFPQFSDNDLYLAGESFAGQYIPYIGTEILKRKKSASGYKMNLQGIMIGNGWIDPQTQYEAYIDFAEQHKLVSSEVMARVRAATQDCSKKYAPPGADFQSRYTTCESILSALLDGSKIKSQCLNMYDIRLTDKTCGMSWPPKLADTTAYLARTDVVQAIHATKKNTSWNECTTGVQNALLNDESPPAITLFPAILTEIQITLFGGDQDLICNTLGLQRMISKLTWNGGTGFGDKEEARERLWKVISPSDGEEMFTTMKASGTYRSARNLTYVQFRDASHMVPIDKPKEAMDMFHRSIGIGGNVNVKSWIEGIDPGSFGMDGKSESSSGNGFLIVFLLALLCAIGVFSAAKWGVPNWMPPMIQNLFNRRDRHALLSRESDGDFSQYDLENFSIDDDPLSSPENTGRTRNG